MDTKIWGIIGGIALALALLSPLVLGSTKRVKQVFEDAEALYEQERYEDASARYNKALERSKKFGVKADTIVPDFQAHVHYKMAECAEQLGRANVALQHYREVIVNFPESQYLTDSYVGSGDIYFDRKEYKAASEEYKRALDTIDEKHHKEQIYQKYQQALVRIKGAWIKPVPVDDINTPDFSDLIEATALRFNERYEDAATQYQTFTDTYLPLEDAIYALYWAGKCYYKARLFQQSADVFKQFIDEYSYNPNAIEAYHGLAETYFDWAKNDEDISKYQLVIQTVEEADRKYAISSIDLEQEVLGLMKEIKRNAEDECESLQPVPPAPPPEEEYVSQGRIHFEAGELELAEEMTRKACRIKPNYQPAKRLLRDVKEKYYEQGLELLDQNHLDSAIVKFDKVIRIYPNFKEAHYHLGVAYYNLGNYAYAAAAANEALGIDPECQEARRLLRAVIEAEEQNQ